MANDPRAGLTAERDEIVERLRAARAVLSPKAAVAAAAGSGDLKEAAALGAAVLQRQSEAASEATVAPQTGFQPRSLTMKLVMERPDLWLKLLTVVATLALGARKTARVGGAIGIGLALWPLLQPVIESLRSGRSTRSLVDEAES